MTVNAGSALPCFPERLSVYAVLIRFHKRRQGLSTARLHSIKEFRVRVAFVARVLRDRLFGYAGIVCRMAGSTSQYPFVKRFLVDAVVNIRSDTLMTLRAERVYLERTHGGDRFNIVRLFVTRLAGKWLSVYLLFCVGGSQEYLFGRMTRNTFGIDHNLAGGLNVVITMARPTLHRRMRHVVLSPLRSLKVHAVALIAVDVRSLLLMRNIIRAEALVAIGAPDARLSVDGRIELLSADEKTDRLSVSLHRKCRIGVASQAIIIRSRQGRERTN